MNSESEQRLSLEELKQRNRSQGVQMMTTPSAAPTKQDWEDLLTAVSALYRLERINSDRLKHLEASVGAQETLLRALTRQAGQLPTQVQLEALARDVAQIQAILKQAGRKNSGAESRVDHHVKGGNRNVADRRRQFDKLFGG